MTMEPIIKFLALSILLSSHTAFANKWPSPINLKNQKCLNSVEPLTHEVLKKIIDAADNNYIPAILKLIAVYEQGEGEIEKNLEEMIFWMDKAVDLGSVYAILQKAHSYRYGTIYKKDRKKARYWYSEILQQEQKQKQQEQKQKIFLQAIISLAYMDEEDGKQAIAEGRMEEADLYLAAAFNHYYEAAKRGSARAKASLSFFFRKGWGCTKNKKESLRWLKQAAAPHPCSYKKDEIQGYAPAQFTLGIIYEKQRNTKKAAMWFNRAARQNYTESTSYTKNLLKHP